MSERVFICIQVIFICSLSAACAASITVCLYQRGWAFSVRMEEGTKPVVVRQRRKRQPPDERYQEWREGKWVDVPYEERGPWYKEKYQR